MLHQNRISQWFSNFYEPWPPSKDPQHIVTLGLCNITAKLLSDCLCSWLPRGAESPV